MGEYIFQISRRPFGLRFGKIFSPASQRFTRCGAHDTHVAGLPCTLEVDAGRGASRLPAANGFVLGSFYGHSKCPDPSSLRCLREPEMGSFFNFSADPGARTVVQPAHSLRPPRPIDLPSAAWVF